MREWRGQRKGDMAMMQTSSLDPRAMPSHNGPAGPTPTALMTMNPLPEPSDGPWHLQHHPPQRPRPSSSPRALTNHIITGFLTLPSPPSPPILPQLFSSPHLTIATTPTLPPMDTPTKQPSASSSSPTFTNLTNLPYLVPTHPLLRPHLHLQPLPDSSHTPPTDRYSQPLPARPCLIPPSLTCSTSTPLISPSLSLLHQHAPPSSPLPQPAPPARPSLTSRS